MYKDFDYEYGRITYKENGYNVIFLHLYEESKKWKKHFLWYVTKISNYRKARGKADKRDCCKKTHQSPQFPSRKISGPAQISPCSKEKNYQDTHCFGIAWNKEEIECVNYAIK